MWARFYACKLAGRPFIGFTQNPGIYWSFTILSVIQIFTGEEMEPNVMQSADMVLQD